MGWEKERGIVQVSLSCLGGDRLHVNKMSDLCIFAGDRGD